MKLRVNHVPRRRRVAFPDGVLCRGKQHDVLPVPPFHFWIVPNFRANQISGFVPVAEEVLTPVREVLLVDVIQMLGDFEAPCQIKTPLSSEMGCSSSCGTNITRGICNCARSTCPPSISMVSTLAFRNCAAHAAVTQPTSTIDRAGTMSSTSGTTIAAERVEPSRMAS